MAALELHELSAVLGTHNELQEIIIRPMSTGFIVRVDSKEPDAALTISTQYAFSDVSEMNQFFNVLKQYFYG